MKEKIRREQIEITKVKSGSMQKEKNMNNAWQKQCTVLERRALSRLG